MDAVGKRLQRDARAVRESGTVTGRTSVDMSNAGMRALSREGQTRFSTLNVWYFSADAQSRSSCCFFPQRMSGEALA